MRVLVHMGSERGKPGRPGRPGRPSGLWGRLTLEWGRNFTLQRLFLSPYPKSAVSFSSFISHLGQRSPCLSWKVSESHARRDWFDFVYSQDFGFLCYGREGEDFWSRNRLINAKKGACDKIAHTFLNLWGCFSVCRCVCILASLYVGNLVWTSVVFLVIIYLIFFPVCALLNMSVILYIILSLCMRVIRCMRAILCAILCMCVLLSLSVLPRVFFPFFLHCHQTIGKGEGVVEPNEVHLGGGQHVIGRARQRRHGHCSVKSSAAREVAHLPQLHQRFLTHNVLLTFSCCYCMRKRSRKQRTKKKLKQLTLSAFIGQRRIMGGRERHWGLSCLYRVWITRP